MKMLLAWLRTVLVETPSFRAISAFSSPDAMNPRTSRSRSVSCGNTSGWGASTCRKYAATRSAIRCPRITSPEPTASTARTISARRAPFEEETPGAGPMRREHGLVVLQHGEDDDADVWGGLDDPPGGLDPVEPRHVQ